LPHRLGGAGDQVLEAMGASPRDNESKRSKGRLRTAADRSCPGDLRPKLGHLDVVSDVLQPTPHHVRHERMHGVAADVNGAEAHTNI
jgi:hypothetical protein